MCIYTGELCYVLYAWNGIPYSERMGTGDYQRVCHLRVTTGDGTKSTYTMNCALTLSADIANCLSSILDAGRLYTCSANGLDSDV